MKFFDTIQTKIQMVKNGRKHLDEQVVKDLIKKHEEGLAIMFGGKVLIESGMVFANGKTTIFDSNGNIVEHN